MTTLAASRRVEMCPVCGGRSNSPILRRDNVAVHQNHPEPTRQAARDVLRGDLHLELCLQCGFIFNSMFDVALTDFGHSYISDQTRSGLFDRHVDALVERLLADGVRGQRIVEVGCGTGNFLERLCARGDNRGIGFDPVYIGPERSADGRAQFVPQLFQPRPEARDADVIVCRHVLAHVSRPFDFFVQLRAAVGEQARFYFETPPVEWSLDNLVALDFYYEGCSYFSEPTLTWLMRRTGFAPARMTRLFDSQYVWIDGVIAAPEVTLPFPSVAELEARVARYRAGERAQIERWNALINRLAPDGPICVWGAGAKGVTFLNLLDPHCTRIVAAIDLNERKQGKFVAASGHPIEGPAALITRDIRSAIIMNPHYKDEITAAIAACGSPARAYL